MNTTTRMKLRSLLALYGIRVDINSTKNKTDYVKFLEEGLQADFVPFKQYNTAVKSKIKPIAFYLPQYYSFPENDKWHGKGFTEWTNATKAKPLFIGHHQPHLPIDLGFYNLENNSVFARQIELAKNYGIYGFAFHYYWFSGKRLMEKPIFNYLQDKSLDFPFCINWACDNWSKLWDGGNNQLLIKSELKPDDAEKFWNDIEPFFKDERYIKIDNKPVLIIYNSLVFDTQILENFIATIRQKALSAGYNGLHIVCAITPSVIKNPKNSALSKFDAFVEFPPHGISKCSESKKILEWKYSNYINPSFRGTILDFQQYINKNMHKNPIMPFKSIYRCLFPGWDNSPRKANSNCQIYVNTTIEVYKRWLIDLIRQTTANKDTSEKFLFINAWNEWGEGAHLEPDSKYGYAYLQATRECLEQVYKSQK